MKLLPDRRWFSRLILLLAMIFGVDGYAVAQGDILEQYKSIRAPHATASIGNDLFGDSNNLYNGSLEFTQTDVSIPGNNALPVAVGRRISTGSVVLGGRPFGKWEMDIPRISGTFPVNVGWLGEDGTRNRCTKFGAPPSAVGTNKASVWDPSEFWKGTFMYIPGEGTQQLLVRNAENQFAPGLVGVSGFLCAGP
jgi:hypothetical protein